MQIADAIANGKKPWAEVDAVVGRIYRLSHADLQLIADAAEFGLPQAGKRAAAADRPNPAMIEAFVAELEKLLKPFSAGQAISVRRVAAYGSPSFEFFCIGTDLQTGDHGIHNDFASLPHLADMVSQPLSASQIRIVLGPGQWLIGQLAQRRYWSKTRARLLALEWLDGGFSGQESVL